MRIRRPWLILLAVLCTAPLDALVLPTEAHAQREFLKRTFRKRGKETPLLGPTLLGQTGLYDVYSADRFPKGGVGVSLFSAYFKEDKFLSPSTNHAKQDAFLSITVAPYETTEQLGIESGLEFSITGRVASDLVKDTQLNQTRQIQAAGDAALGLKYSVNPWGPFHTGLNASAFFLTAEESGLYDFSATSYEGRLLLSLDFAEGRAEESVGFRAHFNGGYKRDQSEKLLRDRKFPVPMSERFALGINGEDVLRSGAGFEVIRLPVAFILEGTFDYDVDSAILDDDNQKLDLDLLNNPLYVTPGLRLLPFENLVIDAAYRMTCIPYATCLTKETNIAQDRSQRLVPDWTLILGLSYTDLPKRQRVKRVQVILGQIRGLVTDAQTHEPVGGAVISFLDPPDTPAVASDPSKGTYLVQNLQPGRYVMKIEKPGYHPGEAQATIATNETAEVNIEIRNIPDIVLGTLNGKVEDPNGSPLLAVVTMDENRVRTGTSQETGLFSIAIEEGRHNIEVESPGFKPYAEEIEVSGEKPTQVTIVLKPVQQVRVTKEKIVIYEKIHFETGKAIILPVSFPILDAVAGVLKKSRSLKVLVEGHTDNRGSRERNLSLSQDRAEAVADYLESKGINRKRLDAKGFADIRPIADNETPEGRSRNRRVEFTITGGGPEEEAPAAAPTPPPPKPAAPAPPPKPEPPAAAPAPAPAPVTRRVEIVSRKPAEVFDVPGGPLTGGRVIGQAPPRAKLPLLDQKGDWMRVRLPDGKEGWINKRATRPLTQ